MSVKVRYDIPCDINIPSRTILYVENKYDDKINSFIKENYEEISSMFKMKDMHFMYIPNLASLIPGRSKQYVFGTDTFKIEAPKDTAGALKRILPAGILCRISHPALCSFDEYEMTLYRLDSAVSLSQAFNEYITARSVYEYDYEGFEEKYSYAAEDEYDAQEEFYHHRITHSIDCQEECRSISFPMIVHPDNDALELDAEIDHQVRFRRKDRENDYTKLKRELKTDENNLSKEQKKLICQAQQNIQKLIDSGLSVELIHALLEPQIKSSRLQITKDFRIFLLDYDEKEIVLGPIDKTVFLFYLSHPEGVNFKDLIDYEDELMDIYSKLTNRIVAAVKRRSISSLVDPTNNSINEKCSRIKRAFLAELALPLAKEYYIDGQLGGDKRITLDRSLVLWDCRI